MRKPASRALHEQVRKLLLPQVTVTRQEPIQGKHWAELAKANVDSRTGSAGARWGAWELRWAKTRALKRTRARRNARVLKNLACRKSVGGLLKFLSIGRQRVGAF